MKKSMWIGTAILVAAAGAAVFVHMSGLRPGDVVELLAEEGEKPLRDPMRPARGTTRVLLFALDGVGADELMATVRSGGAPHIASLLGPEAGDGVFANGYAVPGVLSILPSTTVAAWASIFTGEPPARTGVTGNEFFVREQRRFYAPAPVTVSDAGHVTAVYSDDLVGSVLAVPTVYERADLRSYVTMSHIHRGADLLVIPDISSVAEIAVGMVAGIGDTEDVVDAEKYGELDGESAEMLLQSVRRLGLADLQVVYFPGVDLYTHVANDPLPDQRAYVSAVIDRAVAAVLDAYRAAGVLERTYVLFVSDHGHVPVIEDDRHALEAEGEDEPPAILERVGFRVRPLSIELEESEEDYQAVLAYQGAFAYLYLADRSTCARPGEVCDWSRAPRLEQDVLPVVRAFDAANRTGAHVPALRGTLDLILARAPRSPGTAALPFQVWDGRALVPVEQYLAREPRPDLLRLAERLEGLAAGPHGHRAGDVLLLARSGAARPIDDRYYFSGRYRSWHGSPDAQDSFVPLIVARTGEDGSRIAAHVRSVTGARPTQLHITPLIQALLAR